ncbi:MAG: HAD-IIB family hydrolase [Nitrospirae bacterium]|nr:HAD-IIB family hydrolase [Nitrospirota bacterium]
MENKHLIIFTDLDGTLLDYHTYSFEKAGPAIELLKKKDIPLVICSSKTRAEIEYYRKKLGNHHPFISENGGGIFIPKDYFKFKVQNSEFTVKDNENVIPAKHVPAGIKQGAGIQEDMDSRLRTAGMTEKRGFSEDDDCHVIRLGAQYSDLRKAIETLRKDGFNLKGFGDMTAKEIAEIANMSIDEAEMAKERDFDEPFIFAGAIHELPLLFKSIKSRGFNYTQGRFFHILGDSDKGKAIEILKGLYRKKSGDITTVGLGDSPNDISMFEKVDYPVLVQKYDGSYDPQVIERIESRIKFGIKAEGIGPEGWNKAVTRFILK